MTDSWERSERAVCLSRSAPLLHPPLPPLSSKTPAHPSSDFKWKDYSPSVFRNLRIHWGVHDAEYMISLAGSKALWQLNSPGKSGGRDAGEGRGRGRREDGQGGGLGGCRNRAIAEGRGRGAVVRVMDGCLLEPLPMVNSDVPQPHGCPLIGPSPHPCQAVCSSSLMTRSS